MKTWIIMTFVVIDVKEDLVDLLSMFLEFYSFDVVGKSYDGWYTIV